MNAYRGVGTFQTKVRLSKSCEEEMELKSHFPADKGVWGSIVSFNNWIWGRAPRLKLHLV